jgi:hypothetical protein
MKFLKKFFEHNISIFDDSWKKLLPKKIQIITSSGLFNLESSQMTMTGELIRISYIHRVKGEPLFLMFDIHLVKDNDGFEANPDTLRLNVDITYGNRMCSEFTIEKPNKVNIILYDGKGSKYDSDNSFGFTDESLNHLVKFFNSFGYELTIDDLYFIDKER